MSALTGRPVLADTTMSALTGRPVLAVATSKVMNDGEDLYGIRKFDLSSGSHTDGDHAVVQRPPPVLIRFESPWSGLFAAISTKILSMHSKRPKLAVPVFDVSTLALSFGPQHRSLPSQPMYLPVSDKLVALDKSSSELLDPPTEGKKWSWSELPKIPFNPQDVTSHAVHPDGRTIFVSIKTATYSLDTESKTWRLHGEWKLPFTGRAHFDPLLDAWVGLSGHPDTLGYLCCCDVVSTDPDSSSNRQSPAWKLSNEKLFCKELAEKHIGANLVYMGVRRVCLLQYFSVKEDVSCSNDLPRSRTLLRLLTLSLKYNKKGDLLAETHCPARCYQLPKASKNIAFDDPVAFWI